MENTVKIIPVMDLTWYAMFLVVEGWSYFIGPNGRVLVRVNVVDPVFLDGKVVP